jgi:DNA-binding NarL/FixJ family response regulator/tetratricopeptide (TPR) repeat protein
MTLMTGSASSGVFVGRRDELATVADRLADLVGGGSGGFLLISGEAGVGKSRLVGALVDLADSDEVQVLLGRCIQFGDAVLPVAPVVDILEELRSALTPGELESVLGPARDDLAGLLPALQAGSSSSPDSMDGRRLVEVIHRVLRRLSERRPVVLVFEDLHWADRTTRDLVGYLGLALRDAPVLFVATYRSDDLHRRHPLLSALAELQRGVRPQRLDLAPFDAATSAELVEAIGGDFDVATVEAMHRRSGGNAFYLEELLATSGSEAAIPVTLREVVLSRTMGLDERSLAILSVASVLGPRLGEDFLRAVVDLDQSSINAALHQLVDRRFLVADGQGFRFRHDVTREVFADELLPGERAELHERIAQIMQDRASERLGEIAHHWYHSGNQTQAFRACVAAGESARAAGTTAEALVNYERALELWDRVPPSDRHTELTRPDLLLIAAECAYRAQEPRRAVAFGRQACDELVHGENVARAVALAQLTQWMWWVGEGELDELIEVALELIEAEPPSADVAYVLARAGCLDMQAQPHRSQSAIARSTAALEMAVAAGDRQMEAYALNTIAVSRSQLQEPGAVESMIAAKEFAEEIGEPDGIIRAYINLSLLQVFDHRYEEAYRTALEGLGVAGERDQRVVSVATLVESASYAAAAMGRWDEVDALAEELILWRELDLDAPAPSGLLAWAEISIKRGDLDQARLILEHDLRANTGSHWGGTVSHSICGLLELAILEGGGLPDPELVEVDIKRILEVHSIIEVRAVALRACADIAVTAAYAGDAVTVADAKKAADRFLGHVERAPKDPDHVSGDITALRAQCGAEHARTVGRNEPEQWAEVVEAWKPFKRPWPTAYAQFRYGEALLTSRDDVANNKATAKDVLSQAHGVASDLGAKPLLADIEALATRARIELRSDTEDDTPAVVEAVPFDLTPRELEVLALVTEGYSNGRIGEEVFITTKTASVHVSNILRKLNAANRIEAAAIATRLGITADLRTG